jgi:hypothetical protein
VSTGDVTTMDAESTGAELLESVQGSPAGSGAGRRGPPHAVVSSVAIVTTTDGSKPVRRTRTEPTNSSTMSAAGALTLQLFELRPYGCYVAVERWLVTRTQAKVSPVRRDCRFAITNRCSESTLFAQVSCVNGACLRPGRNGPPLCRLVRTLQVARALPKAARHEVARQSYSVTDRSKPQQSVERVESLACVGSPGACCQLRVENECEPPGSNRLHGGVLHRR